jgi:hypothetical protein
VEPEVLLRLLREQSEFWDFWTRAASTDTTAETIRTVERDYLDGWIQAATTPLGERKVTSPAAARELCALACMCLERGHPMPEKLRAYMASAMRACAEGKPADEALNLKRRKGRYPDPMAQEARDKDIAMRIAWLMVQNGFGVAKAKELAAAGIGCEVRRIEQIWDKHKPTSEQLEIIRAEVELLRLMLKRPPSKADNERMGALLRIVRPEIK